MVIYCAISMPFIIDRVIFHHCHVYIICTVMVFKYALMHSLKYKEI